MQHLLSIMLLVMTVPVWCQTPLSCCVTFSLLKQVREREMVTRFTVRPAVNYEVGDYTCSRSRNLAASGWQLHRSASDVIIQSSHLASDPPVSELAFPELCFCKS